MPTDDAQKNDISAADGGHEAVFPNSQDVELQKPELEQDAPNKSSPPDGGFEAWKQCANVFLLWFASWGLVNSFGVFQAYYTVTYLSATSSQVSWIGSLQLCLFILGSVVIGPIYDTGYLQATLLIGSFSVVFGLVLTSVQTSYAGVILSQGLCMGLGMTCTFIPMISVLPGWFSSRRALATGIAATGSSIGAIIFVIIFQQTISHGVSFGWTVRTMALILALSLVPPSLSMRKCVQHSPKRALIETSALKDIPFILTALAMFVLFVGLYVPYFYIEVFALREGTIRSNNQSVTKYLIVLMNVGSFVGRLGPNILSQRLGIWNTTVLSTCLTGAIGFCWISVTNEGRLIAFCFFYGFMSGAVVALIPVVMATLAPDIKILGTRLGMLSVPMALGLLVGNPIAGAMVGLGRFLGLQLFCGCTVILSALLLAAGRVVKGLSSSTWKL